MAEPSAAPRQARASRPSITIACKIALPWIDLRICKEAEVEEQTQTGPRTIRIFKPTGEFIRIRGTAYPRGEPPEGFPDKPRMVLGYALTEVPRPLWEKYINQSKVPPPFITSGMIVAFESVDDIKDYAKDHVGALSGLEPIQRKGKDLKDARIPKPSRPDVGELLPDGDRMRQRQSAGD